MGRKPDSENKGDLWRWTIPTPPRNPTPMHFPPHALSLLPLPYPLMGVIRVVEKWWKSGEYNSIVEIGINIYSIRFYYGYYQVVFIGGGGGVEI